MPTDDNKITISFICVKQSFAFIHCNVIVSITGQLAVLLNERLVVCIKFTFHALQSPEHCNQSDQLI